MKQVVREEEDWKCPNCGDMLNRDIEIGDGYIYDDICLGCGFKRKKIVEGRVEEIE